MKLLSEAMKVEMGTSLSPTLYVDERANQIFSYRPWTLFWKCYISNI